MLTLTRTNKRTLVLSNVDSLVKDLKRRRKEYNLVLLDRVKGYGINDVDNYRHYLIRRLEYENWVVLERYIKFKDKQFDDFIIAKTFVKERTPKKWATLIRK